MTNSAGITISIPVIANIMLFGASVATTQASIGILPATALLLTLVLSATALSR